MKRIGLAYIDGGSRGNPGPAAFAFTLTEPATGKVIEHKENMGTATNNVAEYSALVEVLEQASAAGFTDLTVRSDSELLVKQMLGQYKVKSPDLIDCYRISKQLSQGFASFTIEHVRREHNKRADELVNQAMDEALGSGAKKKKADKAPKESALDIPMEMEDNSPEGKALTLIRSAADAWQQGEPVEPLASDLMVKLKGMLKV